MGIVAQLAACLPSIPRSSGFHPQSCLQLGMVVLTCSPSIGEVEAGGWTIQNHPCLGSKLEAWDTGDPAWGEVEESAIRILNWKKTCFLSSVVTRDYCGDIWRLVTTGSHLWVSQGNSCQWTPGREWAAGTGDLGLGNWPCIHGANSIDILLLWVFENTVIKNSVQYSCHG